MHRETKIVNQNHSPTSYCCISNGKEAYTFMVHALRLPLYGYPLQDGSGIKEQSAPLTTTPYGYPLQHPCTAPPDGRMVVSPKSECKHARGELQFADFASQKLL